MHFVPVFPSKICSLGGIGKIRNLAIRSARLRFVQRNGGCA
jgi:hypothetical protein